MPDHKIRDRFSIFKNELAENPLIADFVPFLKKVELKRIIPKIKILQESKKFIKPISERILSNLSCTKNGDNDDLDEYLSYYGIDTDLARFSLKSFHSSKFNLALYSFKPEKCNGKIILILHGYFEHTVTNSNLINLLTHQGYWIFGFDLPGHGFSSGERFSVGDFSDYGKAVEDVIKLLPQNPFAIIGHSTGCAAILEFLFQGNSFKGNIILAAPLVKSFLYDYSRIGSKVVNKFMDRLPYIFHKHSNDPNFLLFKKFADVHSPSSVPLSWFAALLRWNEKIVKHNANASPKIFILQGTDDRTVEWKFNLEFIKEKFSKTRVEVIEGAEHDLFNDGDEFKRIVFTEVINILKGEKNNEKNNEKN